MQKISGLAKTKPKATFDSHIAGALCRSKTYGESLRVKKKGFLYFG